MIYGTSHLEATRDEIQGVIRLRAAAEALFVYMSLVYEVKSGRSKCAGRFGFWVGQHGKIWVVTSFFADPHL